MLRKSSRPTSDDAKLSISFEIVIYVGHVSIDSVEYEVRVNRIGKA